jgi:hypothetical protein
VPGIGKASQVRAARPEAEFDAYLHRRADLPHRPESHVARSTILDLRDGLLGYAGNSSHVDLPQTAPATFGSEACTDSEVVH